MTTADKIRELIEEKGLIQRQFAVLVGIHYITLCNNLKNDNFSHKSVVNEAPFDEKLAVFSAYMSPLAKYIDNIHNVISPVTA